MREDFLQFLIGERVLRFVKENLPNNVTYLDDVPCPHDNSKTCASSNATSYIGIPFYHHTLGVTLPISVNVRDENSGALIGSVKALWNASNIETKLGKSPALGDTGFLYAAAANSNTTYRLVVPMEMPESTPGLNPSWNKLSFFDKDLPLAGNSILRTGLENQNRSRSDPEFTQLASGTLFANTTARYTAAYSYINVANARWIIIAQMLTSEMATPISNIRTALMIALIGTFFGTLILSYPFSRALTNPILELLRTANALSEGNLSARVHLHCKRWFRDEIADVNLAFNSMAEQLSDQYGVLEKMVKERTKELEDARVTADEANAAKGSFLATITVCSLIFSHVVCLSIN